MARKIGKKRMTAFFKGVTTLMTTCGAVLNETDYSLVWTLQTIAGELDITLHKSDLTDGTSVFSIFGRFSNVEKAKKKLDALSLNRLNPHSGKWNFHSLDSDILEQLEDEVDVILPTSQVK